MRVKAESSNHLNNLNSTPFLYSDKGLDSYTLVSRKYIPMWTEDSCTKILLLGYSLTHSEVLFPLWNQVCDII